MNQNRTLKYIENQQRSGGSRDNPLDAYEDLIRFIAEDTGFDLVMGGRYVLKNGRKLTITKRSTTTTRVASGHVFVGKVDPIREGALGPVRYYTAEGVSAMNTREWDIEEEVS